MPDFTLRFGNFLAPAMMPVYSAIAEHVGQRLKCRTTIKTALSYRQATTDFDVCFICGLAYIEIVQNNPDSIEPLVAPVLRGHRYLDEPCYFSDVIVHRDSAFQSFEDLRGGSWCFNEPWSQSGYGITRYWLSQLNEGAAFFGRVMQSGWHDRSIELVCNGEIDASAIDCHVLDLAMRKDPSLESKLRVIETLGPSTIQPVTVAKALPEKLKENLRSIFQSLPSVPAMRPSLTMGLIERFAPVEDRSYDDLRAMRQVSEGIQLHIPSPEVIQH